MLACCNVAGSAGANHVHEANGHHLLIPIHFVVLQ